MADCGLCCEGPALLIIISEILWFFMVSLVLAKFYRFAFPPFLWFRWWLSLFMLLWLRYGWRLATGSLSRLQLLLFWLDCWAWFTSWNTPWVFLLTCWVHRLFCYGCQGYFLLESYLLLRLSNLHYYYVYSNWCYCYGFAWVFGFFMPWFPAFAHVSFRFPPEFVRW